MPLLEAVPGNSGLHILSRAQRHGMLIPHTRPLSFLFRRKITRIYHTTLLQRIMNSSVNKWQVLHFLLLSIMYTSLYYCSIQQVLNANGLKNPFADLQPLIKKNSQEHNSKAARLFQDLCWAGLENSLPSMLIGWKPTEFRSFTFVYGAIRSTPAASFNLVPSETKAILKVAVGNMWPEALDHSLCNRMSLSFPWFIFIAHARLYHSPGISQLLCSLHFAYGEWRFMIK